MKQILFYIFLFSIGVVALSFALMNIEDVQLRYYLGSIEAPLSLIVVLSFALGAVLGGSALMGWVLRLKHENSKLEKSNRNTEKKLSHLRATPLKDLS